MWYLLIALAILLLALWGLRIMITKTASLWWSPTAQRLTVLAAATVVSLIFASSNKVEALLAPFGTGTFIALAVIAMVGPTFLDEKITRLLTWVFLLCASVSSVFAAANLFLPKLGSPTLPFEAGWQILLESYKNWRQLLVGVGPENFLSAFTLGRPVGLNMTRFWDTRFLVNSSLILQIGVVYGILGLGALGFLLVAVNPVWILVFFLLPPSIATLTFILFLAIVGGKIPSTKSVVVNQSIPRLLAGVVVIMLAGTLGYAEYRVYAADRMLKASLQKFTERDGSGAYNLQVTAIQLNPRIASAHTALSQTSLALAHAIAQAASDSAREQTTQLVQQSISEAKSAVSLAPKNIIAWENLANVYLSLVGVASGANQWAVAAAQQAAALDPTNPALRLRLGGAYVGQQAFDLASESYLAAIALKRDWANAYYNLAFVYRQQKKFLHAANTMKETLKYVPPGSDDAARAQKELDELRELLTEKEKQTLENPQTPPQAAPVNDLLSPLP